MPKNRILLLAAVFLLAFCLTPETAGANFIQPSEDCESAKKIAGELIDRLVAGDFEGVRTNFNENLKQNLSADQIKNVWTGVISEIGGYESREKSLYQEYPNYYSVFTLLQMNKGRVRIEVHFSEDEKIVGLWVKPA